MFKVLIVDASKLIRWSLKEMLLRDDIQIVEAESFDEAHDWIKTNSFDLVFIDQVKDMECNLRLFEQMKRFQPKSKVIILTSEEKLMEEEVFSALDVFSIIAKPFSARDVKNQAIKALGIIPMDR
jgi:DNA-binding NtrC family response regulator